MELLWLVLSLLALDLAAHLFAADTRPGFQHSTRSGPHRPWGLHRPSGLHLSRRPGRRSTSG
jgi:hypothetical protein